jgi:glycosyltransferase involved in cell wall biosynthesis
MAQAGAGSLGDVASLDAAFAEANAGRSVDLPTAVGFCMYVRRACIEQVGLFDFQTFGHGYGEENDFCLRATERGWRHLAAGDTYVLHEGEASFAEHASSRKTRAMELLRGRYPSYEADVARFVKADPLRALRWNAMAARWKRSEVPVVLLCTHDWGGGTEKHVRELIERYRERVRFLVLRLGTLTLRPLHLCAADAAWPMELRLRLEQMDDLMMFLRRFGIVRMHVHHWLDHHDVVQRLATGLEVDFDVTIHDYAAICPRIQLWTSESGYCAEPSEHRCLSCLQADPKPLSGDIIWWRLRSRELLRRAKRVIVPSVDAAARVRRYFPEIHPIVAPHERPFSMSREVVVPTLGPRDVLRIATLGSMIGHKGGAFLLDCVRQWATGRTPVKVQVIGKLDQKNKGARVVESLLTATGPYDKAALPQLIAAFDPHLIFFPHQWPETYSYALSEALQSGRPILAPAIGAFPERSAGCSWVWLYDPAASPADLTRTLDRIVVENLRTGIAPAQPSWSGGEGMPIAQDFYEVAYLSPIARQTQGL